MASPKWMTTNGLVRAKASAARPHAIASRLHLPQAADDERRQQEHAGVLGARREADRDPGELEPARDHERQGYRHSERERHVRHGHARIGHVGRLHRDGSRSDEPGDGAVGAPPEPPGSGYSSERERDDRHARREIGRLGLPRLEGREEVHGQRRIVEPVRVEPASVAHRPGARDDVPLVGVQEREREAVPDPDEPDRSRERQQSRQRDPRPAPPVFGQLRLRAGPHAPGRRGSGRRR